MKITLKKDVPGDSLYCCNVSKCEVKEGKLLLKGILLDFDSFDYDFSEAIFYIKNLSDVEKLQKITKNY